MGEIAEMMLNGDLDCETGEYLGEGDGYPRTLNDVSDDKYYDWGNIFQKGMHPRKAKTHKCPLCPRKVRGVDAVAQHIKDKHGKQALKDYRSQSAPSATATIRRNELMTAWIDWHGGECPIPDAKAGEFEVKFDGKVHRPKYHNAIDEFRKFGDITAYRLIGDQNG